jgi:hypothetical protein
MEEKSGEPADESLFLNSKSTEWAIKGDCELECKNSWKNAQRSPADINRSNKH